MTAAERLRQALAAIPPLEAEIARTKSWMGKGPSPRERLADLLDDVQTAMADLALAPPRALVTVTAVGEGRVTLRLQRAHAVSSHHTRFVDFDGQVWTFAAEDERVLQADPAVCARAAGLVAKLAVAEIAGPRLVALL